MSKQEKCNNLKSQGIIRYSKQEYKNALIILSWITAIAHCVAFLLHELIALELICSTLAIPSSCNDVYVKVGRCWCLYVVIL